MFMGEPVQGTVLLFVHLNIVAKESVTNLFKIAVQTIEKRKNPISSPKLIPSAKEMEKKGDEHYKEVNTDDLNVCI